MPHRQPAGVHIPRITSDLRLQFETPKRVDPKQRPNRAHPDSRISPFAWPRRKSAYQPVHNEARRGEMWRLNAADDNTRVFARPAAAWSCERYGSVPFGPLHRKSHPNTVPSADRHYLVLALIRSDQVRTAMRRGECLVSAPL